MTAQSALPLDNSTVTICLFQQGPLDMYDLK